MKAVIAAFLAFMVLFLYGCGSNDEVPIITGGAVVDVQEPAQQEELPPAPVPEPREEIKTVKLCHDTDNGIIRWEEGKVFGFYDNASRFEFSDYCEDNVYLTEYYCENEEPVTRRFQCSNGCRQNHCT
ncbi:hypothetical protein J4212_03650 [Candidatus Woesearchaeota archaeon]|nr:hypothetical protein [Candidatus Woesearchaeota archaeon]